MNGVTFDTLNYSKALREAGMPQEQAEAFTEAQKAVIAEVFAVQDLAKQADIMRLEAQLEGTRLDLEAKIETTRHELEAKIETKVHELDAKIETTRLEIVSTKHELEAKIEDTRLEIASTKHDLLKWIIGLAFAQMALMTGLLAFLR